MPLLALTATADGPTRRDIVAQLQLADARVFAAGYDRPNRSIQSSPSTIHSNNFGSFSPRNAPPMLESFIALPGAQLRRPFGWLRARGRDAIPYHAGLDGKVRERNQGALS